MIYTYNFNIFLFTYMIFIFINKSGAICSKLISVYLCQDYGDFLFCKCLNF